MTVIAWDGKILAADTLVTNGMTQKRLTSKIRIIRHGNTVYALSGTLVIRERFEEWLLGDRMSDPPAASWYGAVVIERVDKDFAWKVFSFYRDEKEWGFVELENSRCASGSGRDFALAAMYCGRDAAQAVLCAIEFDEASGGPVEWWVPGEEEIRTYETELGVTS